MCRPERTSSSSSNCQGLVWMGERVRREGEALLTVRRRRWRQRRDRG